MAHRRPSLFACLRGSFTALTAALLIAPQAHAANGLQSAETLVSDLDIETGAAERLDVADMLRTLSQEIPAVACHLHNGMAPDTSRSLLSEAQMQFTANLDALEFGDPQRNIYSAEERRKTLRDVHALREVWGPLTEQLTALAENPADTAALRIIQTENTALFDLSNHLLSELEGEYANPAELTERDVIMLEIAGRQEMLTQKISKEACAVWSGNGNSEDLAASIRRFEQGLNALLDGFPALGIPPAPTPEIKASLTEIRKGWNNSKAHLDNVLNNSLEDPDKPVLFDLLNKKTMQFAEVVHLYADHSKHNR